LSQGSFFDVQITQNINTITITNVPEGSNGFTMIFTAGGGAPYAVTWTPILWPGGFTPAVSQVAAQKDVISVVTPNGGTNWYGFVGGIDMR